MSQGSPKDDKPTAADPVPPTLRTESTASSAGAERPADERALGRAAAAAEAGGDVGAAITAIRCHSDRRRDGCRSCPVGAGPGFRSCREEGAGAFRTAAARAAGDGRRPQDDGQT